MRSRRRPFDWDVQALPGMPKTAGASLTGPQIKAGAKLFYFGGASRMFRSCDCTEAWLGRSNRSERRPDPCVLLLLSKGNNGINTSRFGGRQIAGYQGGDRQTDSDHQDGWRIVRFNAIEHAAHEATSTECPRDTHSDAQEHVSHRLL